MYKLFIFFLFLFTGLAKSQNSSTPIFIEHNSFISNAEQIEAITYKIPYKNLLFIKNEGVYTTAFTLTIEFYNEEEFVLREIAKPAFSTNSYDETLSGDLSYQDIIKVNLEPGIYKLHSILSLNSSDIEYKIPEQIITIDTLSNSKLLEPIIVINKLMTENNNEFILANFGNIIPFAPQKYDLLIGIVDSTINNAAIKIVQFNEEIYSDTLIPFSHGSLEIFKNMDNIVVSIKDLSSMKYYHISGFSHLLNEGIAEINISYDTTTIKDSLITAWLDKPSVLNNPEYSIKLLDYIEEEEIVDDLLSSNEDHYYKNLSQYWIKKYPADGIKYNYAMEEYYSRADYAIKNLSSLNSFDGAERARGRIYITYGPPSSIDRHYTEMNEIVESWRYEKLGRTFVFKDTNGTGKFDLVN